MQKTPLYQVPVPSTAFTTEAELCGQEIRFSYIDVHGRELKGGIAFSGVLATRSRAERCCSVWHIEDAYDTLVEVLHSDWVRVMRSATQQTWRGEWKMHHFMIYLDSVGAFELIADGWEPLPEETGRWE
jgi:hypothetical protein